MWFKLMAKDYATILNAPDKTRRVDIIIAICKLGLKTPKGVTY